MKAVSFLQNSYQFYIYLYDIALMTNRFSIDLDDWLFVNQL